MINTETREATWARTGIDVSKATCVEDVIKTAKLDYEVEKVPVMLPSGTAIPDKFATVKKGTDQVYGIVGNGYTICQNTEAFDFVNYIEEDLQFVKAGETHNGIIYIIAKLPETYVMDDKIQPYVIFQNGHNGMLSVKAAIAPLRIVCQNQFNIAFRKAENTVSIKHAPTLESRLENARELLKTSASYMNVFKQEAEALYSFKLKGKESQIIDTFYMIPENAGSRKVEALEEQRQELLQAYCAEDNRNFRGTAWGLVNAYADVLTHRKPKRTSDSWDEMHFVRTTFQPQLMGKFLNHLKAFQ